RPVQSRGRRNWRVAEAQTRIGYPDRARRGRHRSPMPLSFTGPITLACIVILGIFVYPALLTPQLRGARRGLLGPVVALVAAVTAALAALFFHFGSDTEPALLRGGLALLWAVAPLIAATVVLRVGGGKS